MKRTLSVLFLLALSFTQLTAQNLIFEGGLGLGNVTGKDHSQGKIMLFAALYKPQSANFHWGLELSAGGNFIPSDSESFEGTTEILSPYDANWGNAMIKGRYFFTQDASPIFAGMGIGINSYWSNVNAVEENRVSQINLGFEPEVGITIRRRLTASMKYLVGGSTPSFNGNRPQEYGGNPIQLREEKVNVLMLTLGYVLNCN